MRAENNKLPICICLWTSLRNLRTRACSHAFAGVPEITGDVRQCVSSFAGWVSAAQPDTGCQHTRNRPMLGDVFGLPNAFSVGLPLQQLRQAF